MIARRPSDLELEQIAQWAREFTALGTLQRTLDLMPLIAGAVAELIRRRARADLTPAASDPRDPDFAQIDARIGVLTDEVLELVEAAIEREGAGKEIEISYAVFLIPRRVWPGGMLRTGSGGNVPMDVLAAVLQGWLEDARVKPK